MECPRLSIYLLSHGTKREPGMLSSTENRVLQVSKSRRSHCHLSWQTAPERQSAKRVVSSKRETVRED